MAKCYFEKLTDRGNQIWGTWVCAKVNIEDKMIKFCRKAFKDKYNNYWIYPIYFDDKYFKHTSDFFSEVGVALYPKITKLPKKNKGNEDIYSKIVYETAIKDITNMRCTKPIYVVVKGVRYKDEYHKLTYIEKILSIRKVRELDSIEYKYQS